MTDKVVESRLTSCSTKQMAAPKEIAVVALEDKKGDDIKIIDLKNSYADHLVIVTGSSNTHNQTLADNVVKMLHKSGHVVDSVEGMPSNQWIIVDAGEIVVHVFTPEMRDHYNIEKLYMHNFDDVENQESDDNDLTGS